MYFKGRQEPITASCPAWVGIWLHLSLVIQIKQPHLKKPAANESQNAKYKFNSRGWIEFREPHRAYRPHAITMDGVFYLHIYGFVTSLSVDIVLKASCFIPQQDRLLPMIRLMSILNLYHSNWKYTQMRIIHNFHKGTYKIRMKMVLIPG